MRLKRWAALLTALVLCFGSAALGEAFTKAQMYQTAIDYLSTLEAEDVEIAALYFDNAGNYGEAKRFVMYCQAVLEILGAGEDSSLLSTAAVRLRRVNVDSFNEELEQYGLPAIDDLQIYIRARRLENEGKRAEALALYEQITILDALSRQVDLDLEAQEAQYKKAMALYEEGRYIDAAKIFRTLDWDDSALMYDRCMEHHTHEWTDATCTAPMVCQECGATEGKPLGHDWLDATYERPMVCTRCGETRGEPLPPPVETEEAEEVQLEGTAAEPFLYVENGDGTVTITVYQGTDTAVTVPATLYGLRVTAIGDGAFSNQGGLVSVLIPEGVTAIGSGAFNNCVGLVSVVLPESITRVGANAFDRNTQLSVTVVEDSYAEVCCRRLGLKTARVASSLNTDQREIWLIFRELMYITGRKATPVYAGPGTNYSQGRVMSSNGKVTLKASIDMEDSFELAGVEGSWMLIRYDITSGAANGTKRVGYIRTSDASYNGGPGLAFMYRAATLRKAASCYDDPEMTNNITHFSLKAGASVILLAWYETASGTKMAYIETTIEGKRYRTFIRAESLE